MNYWNSTFKARESVLKRSQIQRSGKPINKNGRRGKRESPKLVKWRRECRERDNYTCQYPECGRYSKHIDVHHIAKRSQRPDLKFEVSNGVCLCRAHHDRTDTHREEAILFGLLSTESYELANSGA